MIANIRDANRSENSRSKYKATSLSHYGTDEGKEASRQGFIRHLHDHNAKISKLNQDVKQFIEAQTGLTLEYEFAIDNKWYDLKVSNSNIVIEIDPSYTHSDLPNHWSEGLPLDYHLNKSCVAEAAGYRCIHIFDWDDLDKISNIIMPSTSIYARKCDLQGISIDDASEFLDNYHIQGKTIGARYAYGLYYDDQLVQVMTFGKLRYNHRYEWELLRLCTSPQFKVVGGASRMFKRFIQDADPQSVISYCDRAKFTGQVYYNIGFTLSHTSSPAKVWSKGDKYVTDNLLRQRGYDQLFGTDFGKGISNEQLMIDNGWRSVYDCGQYVFEWQK